MSREAREWSRRRGRRPMVLRAPGYDPTDDLDGGGSDARPNAADVEDLIDVKDVATVERRFSGGEAPLAQHALTLLARGRPTAHSRRPTLPPSRTTIATGPDSKASALEEAVVFFADGAIAANWNPETELYVVTVVGHDRAALRRIDDELVHALEHQNHLRGKTVDFDGAFFSFVAPEAIAWDDVVIEQETKRDFERNVIDYLLDERRHQIRSRRGVVLAGPPGTGKTSLVAATIARLEGAGITRVICTADSFIEGGSPQRLLRLVSRYLAPALIVFEDIDLIAGERGGPYGHDAIVGSLLSALNGLESRRGPLAIVATTNRPECLDEAAIRPGRFDRVYQVPAARGADADRLFERLAGFPAPAGALAPVGALTGAIVREVIDTARELALENDSRTEDEVARAATLIARGRPERIGNAGFSARD